MGKIPFAIGDFVTFFDKNLDFQNTQAINFSFEGIKGILFLGRNKENIDFSLTEKSYFSGLDEHFKRSLKLITNLSNDNNNLGNFINAL